MCASLCVCVCVRVCICSPEEVLGFCSSILSSLYLFYFVCNTVPHWPRAHWFHWLLSTFQECPCLFLLAVNYKHVFALQPTEEAIFQPYFLSTWKFGRKEHLHKEIYVMWVISYTSAIKFNLFISNLKECLLLSPEQPKYKEKNYPSLE